MSQLPPPTLPQPDPTGGGPQQASPSRSRRTIAIVVGAVAVAAMVAVGAIVMLGGDDNDDGPALDVDVAVEGLEGIVADAEDEGGFSLVDNCPLADLDGLAARVEETLDLDDPIDDTDEGASIVSLDETQIVLCTRGDEFDDSGTSVTVVALLAVDDREFRSVRRDADGDVTDGPSRSHRGGQLESFCAEPGGEDVAQCTAGWSAEGILLLVEITNDDVEAEQVLDELVAMLDEMVESLADQA